MDNKRFEELAQLYFLNEISKEEKVELENYLMESDGAKKEFDSLKQLHKALTDNHPAPLSDIILDESRQNLLGTIRSEQNKTSVWDKIVGSVNNLLFSNYKLAFGTVATLAIGIFIGYLFFSPSQLDERLVQNSTDIDLDKLSNDGIDISNIRFKNPFTDTGEIEFNFNTIKPITYKGGVNDELTMRLLAMALVSSENPGVRLKSLNTLASQTKDNFKPDLKVKKSLITALKIDDNAGVRREALQVLMKFPFDDEVRDAFLFVLQNDRNSGMRVAAINALVDLKQQGKSIDDEIKNVLNKQLETAEENFIKVRAASLLQEVK